MFVLRDVFVFKLLKLEPYRYFSTFNLDIAYRNHIWLCLRCNYSRNNLHRTLIKSTTFPYSAISCYLPIYFAIISTIKHAYLPISSFCHFKYSWQGCVIFDNIITFYKLPHQFADFCSHWLSTEQKVANTFGGFVKITQSCLTFWTNLMLCTNNLFK